MEAEDDCVANLQLEVFPPIIGASCDSTVFTVTSTDSRCRNQTATRQFIMKVDDNIPTVSINFDPSESNVNYLSEVQEGVYLGIVSNTMSQCFLVMCVLIATFKL